ncbi:GNAT family N-acetyltransferase [Phytoactinopolyspora limicola]|uniref:GNAT family N-acetyltransferase n=1 Tax=Phytoactinopolyspora limicola TaxID=2715536 RepID=UPI00140C9D65|nr:GNAT family N-acetyltransferase [Phytoactinopolyspora limicola]
MRIRPMRTADIDAAERVTAQAFAPSPPREHTGSLDDTAAAPGQRPPLARQRWTARLAHFLSTDPDGAWVADAGDDIVGIAVAVRRDLLWILSSYAVAPGHQGRGIGKALLDAALAYGAGCLRGAVCALPDPRALRRYRQAGFTLHPTMRLVGVVDHDVVPDINGVRVGSQADLELVDSVDRQIRGATHRPDHGIMAGYGPLLVCDTLTGSGYTYLDRSGVGLLAATRRGVAQRLLWAALAQQPPGTEVIIRYLTADQEWAVDVGLAAGLRIEAEGFLALRHMRPPTPYVPSVPFG